ncbi:MAG: hypothetical protein M4579_002083 [Chaenotheca gracillima]|nr:MAG: hypothetical protein M4579_002083 [Chaenotheca gracillima]
MYSRGIIAATLGVAASLIGPAAAYWKLPCSKPLVTERADPVVSPGKVSGHVHTIMGGDAFNFAMNYDDTQKSTCSTCKVNGDFSNYWVPSLYYKAQNGSFISVEQNGGSLIYYLVRPDFTGQKLVAFPEGFQMVAGDPFRRSFNESIPEQAISFACLGSNSAETNGLPNYNCPDGIRAQVFFPSCWNGKDLDSDDHKSHIVYPSVYNAGVCPEGFGHRTISLFYEVIWHTEDFADQWYGDSQPFVFSNGDPTGYGYHGDFVNGWDVDLLQDAINTCTSGNTGYAGQGDINDCAVLKAKFYDDDTMNGCILPPSVDETVDGVLKALPGCNPVQSGPAEAVEHSNCAATKKISTPEYFFTDLTDTKKWEYIGCGSDVAFQDRTLSGASTSGDNMTIESCVDFCGTKGFSFAGTEFSDECYCGDSIPSDRMPTPGVPGDCTMACAGDDKEYCGGAQLISLYKKCNGACENAAQGLTDDPTGSAPSSSSGSSTTAAPAVSTSLEAKKVVPVQEPSSSSSKPAPSPSSTASSSALTLPSGWKASGCYVDPVNPRALDFVGYWGEQITTTGCVKFCDSKGYAFAGTENAGQCFCGHALNGGKPAASSGECDAKCKGDASETCGGSARLSLFEKSGGSTGSRLRRTVHSHVRRHRTNILI